MDEAEKLFIMVIALIILVAVIISISQYQKENKQLIDEIIEKQNYADNLSDSLFLLRDIIAPFNLNDTVTVTPASYVMSEYEDNHTTVYGGFSFWVNHTVPYGWYIPQYLDNYDLVGKTSFLVVFGDYGEHIWIKDVIE